MAKQPIGDKKTHAPCRCPGFCDIGNYKICIFRFVSIKKSKEVTELWE